jgi:adenylate kinase family enzyme
MAAKDLALPAALWISQVVDFELKNVAKAERKSLLRLIGVFSENSTGQPEVSDEAVLRRSFSAISSAYIEKCQEVTELGDYVKELETKAEAAREAAEGDRLMRAREMKSLKIRATELNEICEEWKKRCMGWKRNCMDAERKYKVTAGLCKRKLGIVPTARQLEAGSDLTIEEADAVKQKLSPALPVRRPKSTLHEPKKQRAFRLGDDINAAKRFGEDAYAAPFPKAHRFGPGSGISGQPSDRQSVWHSSSREASNRRAPRGVGRRPWQSARPTSAPGGCQIQLAGQLETLVAMNRSGHLDPVEFGTAKAAILKIGGLPPAVATAAMTRAGFTDPEATIERHTDSQVGLPSTICVLGGPGSGKSSLCSKLAQEFGLAHLSLGEILRRHAATVGGAEASEISDAMRTGKLAAPELVTRLLSTAAVEARASGRPTLVLDGYPLTVEQVTEMLELKSVGPPNMVFFLDCPESEMIRRVKARSKRTARVDDNAVIQMIETFTAQTLPVIDRFERLGLLRTVGSSKSAAEAYTDMRMHWLALTAAAITSSRSPEKNRPKEKAPKRQAATFDPSACAASVARLRDALKDSGKFENIAEAFVLFDADGEDTVKQIELTRGMRMIGWGSRGRVCH